MFEAMIMNRELNNPMFRYISYMSYIIYFYLHTTKLQQKYF